MIYLDLFITFFRIGLFTFGGGYAMLPLIQEEVASHGWMSAQELIDFVAVSESTPGPFAINIATYVGSVTGGFFGSCCSTLGVVLPSFIVILIVARFYQKFQQSRIIKGCMAGLKPAVLGLIGSAVASMAVTVFAPLGLAVFSPADPSLWVSAGIFVLMLFLVLKKKLHPILIVVLSAAIGIAAGFFL